MKLALLVVALASMAAAKVIQLTPENFDEFVSEASTKPAFVEFFAPWCGHCKALAPEYEIAGTTFEDSDPVVIGAVDADTHRSLGSRFGVSGFPTLKWFPAGSVTPEDYQGGRTANDIVSFINKKTGLNRRVKKAPTAVNFLDESNFDSVVMDPEADVLVEFFAPWCGHCKALAPTYEKVAQAFSGEDKVVVAAVDATAARNVASRYDVQGYPTLKFFPKGSKEPQEYQGGRSLGDFVSFLNDKAGTHRTADGGLAKEAGRVEAFDAFAAEFMIASADARSGVVTAANAAAEKLSGADQKQAKYYIKAMGRVQEKGDEWVAKETARLTKIVKSSSVAPGRKTSMMLRLNVLSAFAVEDSSRDEL